MLLMATYTDLGEQRDELEAELTVKQGIETWNIQSGHTNSVASVQLRNRFLTVRLARKEGSQVWLFRSTVCVEGDWQGSEVISEIPEVVFSTLSAGRDHCPGPPWVSVP